MAETKQGAFDIKYHHIDAPTVEDRAYKELHKKRILDNSCSPETFRDELVALLADKTWLPRRKLDGANIRIMWDGEQALWNGKTDKFVATDALAEFMSAHFAEEMFEEMFNRDTKVALFGEHMGPKVQCNELGLAEDEVIIYDVTINGFWQERANVREIASFFDCRTCYDFGDIEPTSLNQLIYDVSHGAYNDWEGIVATPQVECKNQRGERIIVKIKGKDYYREDEDES